MILHEGVEQVLHEVNLPPEDAELTVAAVLHYVSYTAKTLGEYWDVEGVRGLPPNVDQALINLDGMAAIITHGSDLANKLVAHQKNPEVSFGLAKGDFSMLGYALELYAQENFVHTQAIKNGSINPVDGKQDTQDTPDALDQRRAQTENIYNELALTAEQAGESWIAFSDSDHAAHLGRVTLRGQQLPAQLIKFPPHLYLIGKGVSH